jgi:hypothetical protein
MAATAFCAGVWGFTFLPGWPVNSEGDPPHAIIMLFFLTNLIYLPVLLIAVGFVIAGWHEKRSGRRTAPGGGLPVVVHRSQFQGRDGPVR